MTLTEIRNRALATAIQSFTAVLIGGGVGLIDAALWQQAAVAALGGVVTVVHRASSQFLEAKRTPYVDLRERIEGGHVNASQALLLLLVVLLVLLVVDAL